MVDSRATADRHPRPIPRIGPSHWRKRVRWSRREEVIGAVLKKADMAEAVQAQFCTNTVRHTREAARRPFHEPHAAQVPRECC